MWISYRLEIHSLEKKYICTSPSVGCSFEWKIYVYHFYLLLIDIHSLTQFAYWAIDIYEYINIKSKRTTNSSEFGMRSGKPGEPWKIFFESNGSCCMWHAVYAQFMIAQLLLLLPKQTQTYYRCCYGLALVYVWERRTCTSMNTEIFCFITRNTRNRAWFYFCAQNICLQSKCFWIFIMLLLSLVNMCERDFIQSSNWERERKREEMCKFDANVHGWNWDHNDPVVAQLSERRPPTSVWIMYTFADCGGMHSNEMAKTHFQCKEPRRTIKLWLARYSKNEYK